MRKHWRFVTFTALWGVLLLGLGTYAARNGQATSKEQRTIAESRPTVDMAAEAVLAAAGPDRGVRVSGFELRSDCKINPARQGSNYQRVVDLYVPVGQERQVLEDLRAKLPPSYKPRVVGDVLAADPGDFVRVTGALAGPGRVEVAAYTGCRGQVTGVTSAPVRDDRAPVTAVFNALGVQPVRWAAHQVGCATTTVGVATGVAPGPLPSKFPGRALLVSTDDRVVYREGGAGAGAGTGGGGGATVAVEIVGGTLTVARTVGCG